jgi:S-adenosylmethionine:tRNA ribosyltransferase-isomerase
VVASEAVKTSDFDYELPVELIAQQPLADRTASRMMVVDRASGEIRHGQFCNFGRYLLPGDLLVLNNTKVIPARTWSTTPEVEILLVEDLGENRWSAMLKPGKRSKPGAVLTFAGGLTAAVESETDFGGRVLHFSADVQPFLAEHGVAPLPPYIKRAQPGPADLPRYQTVYATHPGAVAAPTAGLHFTPEMLAQFPHAFVTLHVGIGTFRPVKVENVEDHKMHAERFSIPAETKAAIDEARRVVAIGTTVVRALESAGEGSTDIFIRPPFEFRVVDALLTNFHLPKSTLLMLVSAFASRDLIFRAYREAVHERYRFFSYGDCMLIL